jgi:serine acetyltransferase
MFENIEQIEYKNLKEEDIWEIYLRFLDKESPLLNFSKLLGNYRSIFQKVYYKVLWEHKFIRASYYTVDNRVSVEDRVPIFNPFHLEHLTRLTQYFSQEIYQQDPEATILLDNLFFVMRSRFNINLFYKQIVNDFFLPRHALGSVLGYGKWGRFLDIRQCCTIGQNYGKYPTIGDGVILGPYSSIIGDCNIGDNVRLSAGTIIIDTNIESNSLVFGRSPNLVIKNNKNRNVDEHFFYDDFLSFLAVKKLNLNELPASSIPFSIEQIGI